MTQSKVKQILNYDEDTGIFRWKIRPANRIIIGSTAGSVCPVHNYIHIGYRGKLYKAHQLAWLYVYGYMAKGLDHINHTRGDNSIKNLRECTHSENQKNQKMHSRNTSGVCGVTYRADRGSWYAFIDINKKTTYLGSFKDKQEAIECRQKAEIKYGYHNNHGTQNT